jgi:MoaA/NifB/PqqE/SkfB family radical SAM enzyme
MAEEKLKLLREPTDFGDRQYPSANVNITNACNLNCPHCFVFREENPSSPKDKMDDRNMLHQLRILRDKHGIRHVLLMGGEPMIVKDLMFEAAKLFDSYSIVTNGTYGIPSCPDHLVTVSLDGPERPNDAIRGEGVFQKVRDAVFARDPADGTTVMLQMTVTRQNHEGMEEFVETVKDWPINGVAFTFYVPRRDDQTGLAWEDLRDRDDVVKRLMEIKRKNPGVVKTNIGALELMLSDRCHEITENCTFVTAGVNFTDTLPLYMGKGGRFERTYCCYGNDVDCSTCGTYGLFNAAYKPQRQISQEVLSD